VITLDKKIYITNCELYNIIEMQNNMKVAIGIPPKISRFAGHVSAACLINPQIHGFVRGSR
jgi:hypothetical protein